MLQSVVEIALISAMVFSVAYVVVATAILAYERLRHSIRREPLSRFDFVSILKPLKGLDDQLEANLRSFFTLDYPRFELIFGVADENDPAVTVVRGLMRDYPEIPARLVIDSRQRSLNPKINNLRNMYPRARYDYLLISDSNIRVDRDYLSDLMSHIQKSRVGLVTSTIRGVEARTLAGVFENLHLNSFVATSVFAVRRLFRVPVVIGKSMLLSRDTLRRLGGFPAFGDFLAEDQLIGLGVRELGLKIRTSTCWINNINESWNWEKFLNRHVRWAKMRRNLDLANYVSEILSHPLPLAALFMIWRSDLQGVATFTALMTIKYLCDIIAIAILRSDLRFWQLAYLPIKDLVLFGVWFVPFFDRTVVWRGHRFTIERRTELQRVVTAPAE